MNDFLKIWRPLCHIQFCILLAIYTVLGLSPNPGTMVPMFADWLMHSTGYIVAGISISFAWPRVAIWKRGLFLLAYSFCIEIGQHFMPPRTFSMLDMLANLTGITIGLLAFMLLKKIWPPQFKALIQP